MEQNELVLSVTELTVGSEFEISVNGEVFIGRADTSLSGRKTYRVRDLKDNSHISNYALRIESIGGEYVIDNVVLQDYRGKNEVRARDARGRDVSLPYHTGVNTNLSVITVQDLESKSGFEIEPSGDKRFRLSKVMNMGQLID